MRGLTRVLAFATVIVITTVAYCAQSCFDVEAMKPDCPVHHTHNCCQHQAPDGAVTSQALNTLSPSVGKYVSPAFVAAELASLQCTVTDVRHCRPPAPLVLEFPCSASTSSVLRI